MDSLPLLVASVFPERAIAVPELLKDVAPEMVIFWVCVHKPVTVERVKA